MILFVTIFIALMLLSFLEINQCLTVAQKKHWVKFITYFFIILSTLRIGNSGDRESYLQYFNQINLSHLYLLNNNQFEYLYEMLNVFVKYISNNYFILQFAEACAVMLCFKNFYLNPIYSSFNQYSMTILFTVWALNYGNIYIIRSTIALAFIAVSYQYIFNRDFKRFIFYTTIAFGFHNVSIVWVAAYFIYNIRIKKRMWYVIFGGCLLFHSQIMNFMLKILSIISYSMYRRIYSYLSRDIGNTYGISYSYGQMSFKAVANIIFLLIIFVLVLKYTKVDLTERNRIIGIFKLYMAGSVIYVFALLYSLALSRAALPYNMAQYILLPYVFSCFGKKSNRCIIFLIFSLYLFFRFIVNIHTGVDIRFAFIN